MKTLPPHLCIEPENEGDHESLSFGPTLGDLGIAIAKKPRIEPENECSHVELSFVKWKIMTGEIMEELAAAREALSQKAAFRGREATGTFVPMDRTWADYCRDVGISKSTVNRWLAAVLVQH